MQAISLHQRLHTEARRLAAAGVPVFPCVVGSKLPATANGFEDATTDLAQVDRWWGATAFNIGVPLERIGQCVIDTDGADAEAALLDLQLAHEFFPPTRIVQTPRGDGFHFYFMGSLPPTVGKVDRGLGPKIDTRGVGSYVLVPPSFSEEHQREYEVTDDSPPCPLPAWVAPLAGRRRESAKAADNVCLDSAGAIGRASILLRAYVERGHIAREGHGGDSTTYAVAAEVMNLGLSQEKAFDLIDTIWNMACVPPWSPDELAIKIANAAEYAQNDQGAWAVPPVAERIPREALDSLIAESAAGKQGERSRFAWMDEAEFVNMPPPIWLIKDMLTTDSIAMMFGPSGHYKSFIGLNVAAHVAQTGDCAFYVAAEGIARMARKDYPAWKTAYAEDRKLPFYMVEDMPLCSEPGDLDAFADSIKGVAAGRNVALIVLDTLNNAMLGLEENSAKDTGQFIAACKAIKRTFGCTVLVIHHTKKDGSEERGSGALYAGFDTVLKVIADKGVKIVRMFVNKQKTAEERPIPFCYEGKRYGEGLAFTPIEPQEAAVMSAEADIYSPKAISGALVALKAFEPVTVSSQVLLSHIVPQLENETDEQRRVSITRAARGLLAAIKAGRLDGYHTGLGKDLKWSLPSPQ